MRRTVLPLAIAALALCAGPALPERDPDGPLETLIRERAALLGSAPIAGPAQAQRRAQRARPAALVALVDRWADRFGVPREVARFHVDHESGWLVRARNAKSTATGLFQPVRASHAAIIGRDPIGFSVAEHIALASDPEENVKVGLAHIRACMDFMPGASAAALWRRCHVAGHRAVGGDIRVARAYFARVVGSGSPGWLSIGSVAMPWAKRDGGAS